MLSDEELSAVTGGSSWRLEAVGGGFQGSHFRLEDAATGRRWFVKAQPPGPAGRFYDKSGAFVKEPNVYSELLPALKPHLKRDEKLWPDVYLSRKGAMVLEDLTSSGWTLAPKRLDKPHILVVLDSLADLHAASMRLEADRGPLLDTFAESLKESYFGEEAGHPGMETWVSFTGTVGKICRRYFSGREWKKATKLMGRTRNMAKPSRVFRNCVCHGDPWQNNIFFKYHEEEPISACFVDWAQARYCPPSLETLLFLRHLQVEEVEPYLKHYRQRLRRELPDFSEAEFAASLGTSAEPFARCLAALYVYLTRLPETALARVTRSEEAFWEFARGEDGPALDALETDQEYRSAVLRAVEELLDWAEGNS